jgi:hypothetical protein
MMTERAEFDAIRPYEAGEMKQAFEELLADRQFNIVMKGFAPWLPKAVRNGLLRLAFMGIKTPLDFQKRFMKPVVKYIIRKHTDGCSFLDSAIAGYDKHQRYTFVSNHRDIVLDSAFLDVMLVDAGYPTTVEIGIGIEYTLFCKRIFFRIGEKLENCNGIRYACCSVTVCVTVNRICNIYGCTT